jgi:hypothetical protein
MQRYDLKDFTGGWVAGHFEPSLMKMKDAEVAIKRYKQWHREPKHVHNLANELTIIVEGTVLMNNHIYGKDSIILINAGEATDFFTLTDVVTCVIKSPSVSDDKYIV